MPPILRVGCDSVGVIKAMVAGLTNNPHAERLPSRRPSRPVVLTTGVWRPSSPRHRSIVSGMLLPRPAVLYRGVVVGDDVVVERVPFAGLPLVLLPRVLPTSRSSASAS